MFYVLSTALQNFYPIFFQFLEMESLCCNLFPVRDYNIFPVLFCVINGSAWSFSYHFSFMEIIIYVIIYFQYFQLEIIIYFQFYSVSSTALQDLSPILLKFLQIIIYAIIHFQYFQLEIIIYFQFYSVSSTLLMTQCHPKLCHLSPILLKFLQIITRIIKTKVRKGI